MNNTKIQLSLKVSRVSSIKDFSYNNTFSSNSTILCYSGFIKICKDKSYTTYSPILTLCRASWVTMTCWNHYCSSVRQGWSYTRRIALSLFHNDTMMALIRHTTAPETHYRSNSTLNRTDTWISYYKSL